MNESSTAFDKDQYFMKSALQQAQQAFDTGEVPVGTVVVCNNQIIAKGHNTVECLNDVTAHAEMIAITSASEYLGNKYLPECTLYVTLEPCLMCASAMKWAQLGRLVYGASDLKHGFSNHEPSVLHGKTKIKDGLLNKQCADLLTTFFKIKRSKDNLTR